LPVFEIDHLLKLVWLLELRRDEYFLS